MWEQIDENVKSETTTRYKQQNVKTETNTTM